MNNQLILDYKFLNICKAVSALSDDPSTQVGSVTVDSNNFIKCTGFNHLPVDINNKQSIFADRSKKYARIIHAELSQNHNIDISKCTVYGYPIFSCERCTSQLIHRNVSRIVGSHREGSTKYNDIQESIEICKESGTEFTVYKPSLLEVPLENISDIILSDYIIYSSK